MKTIEKECLGKCPKCGSDYIIYGDFEFKGEQCCFEANCNTCFTDFEEWYEMKYSTSCYNIESE